MQRLALTDYLFILLLIILLTFGVSHLLQTWLNKVSEESRGRIHSLNY